MKAKYGIWEIKEGKGDRVYIHCTGNNRVMHPEQLTGLNGLGVYGITNLKDLAVAILKFEKQCNDKESIINKFEKEDKNG